jgi:hypothetical protein
MTERRRLPHKRASQNFSFECADHTVLTGTIVEHGKIYFDFIGDETSIGTFSTRAVPTRRA